MYKLYYIIYKNNKLSGYVKIHNYIYDRQCDFMSSSRVT